MWKGRRGVRVQVDVDWRGERERTEDGRIRVGGAGGGSFERKGERGGRGAGGEEEEQVENDLSGEGGRRMNRK